MERRTGESEQSAWVGVVANAYSGRGRGRSRVEKLVEALRRRGRDARVAWTLDEHEALVEDTGPESGCGALAIVGGDGTVGSVINRAPKCPIGVLPTGTENLFARHCHFPSGIEKFADLLVLGRSRPIDVGEANGRRFALMAGFGFDAEVVSRHHAARVCAEGRPRATSRAAYVEPILRSSLGYRFPEIHVAIDDPPHAETLTGSTVLIFNLPRYALGLPFAPAARDDDGCLDLIVFRRPGALQALWYLWLVLVEKHLARKSVVHRRLRRGRVWAEANVPAQLDGDPAGVLQASAANAWSVSCLPGALRVLTSMESG